MQSKATTVEQYLAELPDDRRTPIQAVRQVILKNLDKDYEEGMQYGMIGYYVPHRIYPPGYHVDPRQPLPFVCLASQKNYMSVYLGTVYGEGSDEPWFREQWAKTGKQLDMGKTCIRFKTIEDVALDVLGEAIRRAPAYQFIAHYESAIKTMSKPADEPAPKKASKASATAAAKITKTSKPATAKRPVKKKASKATSAAVAKTTKTSKTRTVKKPVKKATNKTVTKKVTRKSVKKAVKKKATKR